METEPVDNNQDPTTNAIERVTETMGGVGSAALHGASSEVPHYTGDLLLPRNIHDVLERQLVDAGMPGGATDKYRIPGRPDLLVRQTAGAEMEATLSAMQAAHMLRVPMAPVRIVEHNGKAYHITSHVEGECVEDILLTGDVPPALFEALDKTWGKLTRSLIEAFQTGLLWPTDIEGPNQFMWGTIHGQAEPRVWLVDLPADAEPMHRYDAYAYELLRFTGSVYDIEQAAGRRIEGTRAALAEAIALCPDSRLHGDGLRNAIAFCLEHTIDFFSIRDEEAFIQSMRTI